VPSAGFYHLATNQTAHPRIGTLGELALRIMSRAKRIDNSAAVSLFPFLAVLLCTMGALLVVLVAVSRSARDARFREAAQQQAATLDDGKLQRECDKLNQYVKQLEQLRHEAQQRLRENQLRLGHLENHMRRLHDELAKIQIAAAEMKALELEHYHDRSQAERELARLQRLIADTRSAIDSLQREAKSVKRTYALIPYEGPNGTFRRPLYVECVNHELILQPEGVRITSNDLRPPLGPGNPLAAALRAARDHYAHLNPEEGSRRDAEPYPLLVVRPSGLMMYDRARRAIESSDFDFGFELVEEDWELKYPVADPQLAALQEQAIAHARLRQQALAAAAPRAYRHSALVAVGQMDVDEENEGMDFGPFAGTTDAAGNTNSAVVTSGAGDAPRADNPTTDTASATLLSEANTGAASGLGGPEPTGTSASSPESSGLSRPSAAGRATTADGSVAIPTAAQNVAASTSYPAESSSGDSQLTDIGSTRGRDGAWDRKKPNAVPIRRTIQVVVQQDHIIIVSENAANNARPGGKRIDFEGDTVQSLQSIVAALRAHVDAWGLAGDGLYWRPVLILNVSADGQRRAEDLARLLKNSGFELQTSNLATNNPEGTSRATR